MGHFGNDLINILSASNMFCLEGGLNQVARSISGFTYVPTGQAAIALLCSVLTLLTEINRCLSLACASSEGSGGCSAVFVF